LSVTITENARNKIISIKTKRQSPDSCLRVFLKSGGCSGFTYEYDFVESPMDGDRVFQFENLTVCIEKKSYLFLNGTEIDYEEDLFKSGIVFNNPNATRSCGCGESIAF
jgi:iron-sulfur cluster assembly protein